MKIADVAKKVKRKKLMLAKTLLKRQQVAVQNKRTGLRIRTDIQKIQYFN